MKNMIKAQNLHPKLQIKCILNPPITSKVPPKISSEQKQFECEVIQQSRTKTKKNI